MKKVCVVTWSGGTNYGTNLQAFALVKKLSLLGYDAKMKGSITGNFSYFTHPSFVMNRILFKIKSRSDSQNRAEGSVDNVKVKKFQNFGTRYLPRLDSHGKDEWKKVEEDYVAFVTGSDQVWNPNYFQSAMMLDFVKTDKIKKIAYAPSIGVKSLPAKTQRTYKKLLASYSAIGVREQQAAYLLEELSPVPVEVVLDPTLLLETKDWDDLIQDVEIDKSWGTDKPYILCYFVGTRDYSSYIKLVKEATGLNCIIIPMENDMSSCGNMIAGVGPKEFVWLIKNASIVCTDSFHATVFSILYQKEFYVLKRFNDNSQESQNGRLYEILAAYKLKDRWISDETKFKRNTQINYSEVNCILNDKRKRSEAFLVSSLME